MPLDPSAPGPLRIAVEDMETKVAYFKRQLAYAAPETYNAHFAILQQELFRIMKELYEEKGKDDPICSV